MHAAHKETFLLGFMSLLYSLTDHKLTHRLTHTHIHTLANLRKKLPQS